MSNLELAEKARVIWRRHRNADSRPSNDERDVLLKAYYASVLPRDPDFNVYQWVEDGYPPAV